MKKGPPTPYQLPHLFHSGWKDMELQIQHKIYICNDPWFWSLLSLVSSSGRDAIEFDSASAKGGSSSIKVSGSLTSVNA